MGSRQRLSKKIGHVINRGKIRDHQLTLFNQFTNTEETPFDMLHPVTMFRIIIRQVASTRVVSGKGNHFMSRVIQFF